MSKGATLRYYKHPCKDCLGTAFGQSKLCGECKVIKIVAHEKERGLICNKKK